jgi:hypothetical protein
MLMKAAGQGAPVNRGKYFPRKAAMFVVDFISASVLAGALTIGCAALVRHSRCRRLGKVSASMWLIAVASWCGGMLLVGFGPTLTGRHWLIFVASALVILFAAAALLRRPRFREAVQTETAPPGADAQPLIAGYFIVTLLLFFCAISIRFFIANFA